MMKKILAAFLLFISFSVNAEISIKNLCFTIQATKQAHSKVIGDFIDHQNSAYFHGRIVLLMELKELLECHRFKTKLASKNKPSSDASIFQDGN